MEGAWQVLKQEAMTVALEAGGFGPVVRVTFKTKGGAVSYVDVPRDSYTVDNVRAAIDEHAAALDAVAQL